MVFLSSGTKVLTGLASFVMIIASMPFCAPFVGDPDARLQSLKLLPGFKIEIYAEKVSNARSMVMGEKGTLFVATRGEGKVYAILDRNNDHKADTVITIAKGLRMPNGVAFRKGALYVAEVSRILRYDGIEDHLHQPAEPVVVYDQLPTDRHHGWKYIAFGPDDKLYVPVGAPCNICESEKPVYAAINRMDPDGSNLEVFAHGVRNTVGFTWHPTTKNLWFTDNGRDWLGDDSPADELNHAPQPGMHFGYPYCHAGDIKDPELGDKKPCSETTPPAQKLGPHVAALGLKFYTGQQFPKKYQQQLFIAEHGSWNRSTPLGYRVMLVTLAGDKVTSYTPFIEGWLQGNNAWGRPVDILQLQDGSFLISDDTADLIYRVSYVGT